MKIKSKQISKNLTEALREIKSWPSIFGNLVVNKEMIERQELILKLANAMGFVGLKKFDELDKRLGEFRNDRLKRMLDA